MPAQPSAAGSRREHGERPRPTFALITASRLAYSGSVAPAFFTLTQESQDLTSSLVRLSVHSEAEDLTGLGALSALRILDLSANRISELSELGGLTTLEQLDLRGNRVSGLEALATLQSLRTLNLEANQVENLDGLTGLGALSLLLVTTNRLTSLDSVDLPALVVLEAGITQSKHRVCLPGLSRVPISETQSQTFQG